MTDLLDNIGKGFNRRNLIHDRNVVTVYVENEDDVPFWKHIFEKFKIPTSITPNTHEKDKKSGLKRGKQNVLRFVDQTNKDFVLCVDSDYDYLLDGATKQSQKIKDNLFIFQTYTYSIENYKCFAESLRQVAVEATLNDEQVFDFVSFMEKYSEIVYELFLYSFYYEKQNQQENELYQREYQIKQTQLNEAELRKWQNANLPKHSFQIKDFCGIVKKIPNQVNTYKAGQELAELQQFVTQKLTLLPKIDDTDLETLKVELGNLGLKPNNTYLFVQGHTIYRVVLILLKMVSKVLEKQKFDEYKKQAITNNDAQRKRNEYNNLVKKVETVLNLHKNYESCPLMQKIKYDIEKYKTQFMSKT